MFDESNRTFLDLIVPDSTDEGAGSLASGLGDCVDRIRSRREMDTVYRIHSLDDLISLSADGSTGICPDCWEIEFRETPSVASLCALLGEAIDRCKPKSIGVCLKPNDDLTPRLLMVFRMILVSLNRCPVGLRLVSCPTCARCRVSLIDYAREVQERLRKRTGNLVVAVMGCEVNGPGEAKSSDVGIAFGRGAGLIFRKGEKICKVPADKAVDALMDEVDRLLGGKPEETPVPRPHKCSTCGKPVAARKRSEPPPPGYPFCSERCKQVDLGKWFVGHYRISSQLNPEDDEMETPEDEISEETEST